MTPGRCLLLLGLLGSLLGGLATSLPAQDQPTWRSIDPPADWVAQVRGGRWSRVTSEEWELLQRFAMAPTEPDSPVLMHALYRATFDGTDLRDGTFTWTLQPASEGVGFADLGPTNLAVEKLQFEDQPALHGIAPDGRWLLQVPRESKPLRGLWSRRGAVRLGDPHFDLTFPRALASEVELRVPAEWTVVAQGASLPATESREGATTLWRFAMGRQPTLQLRMERRTKATEARLLVKETSTYGVTAADDLVRVQSNWECFVDGGSSAILKLAVPKTLRVYNVLLGAELPLRFERQLGSEADQIDIPLRSLGGQRVTIQLLGEARADRTFTLPRIRPANADLLEGTIRVAVDRPLQVMSMQPVGLRQVQITERDGQEVWAYEVTASDSQLAVSLGEPNPVPQVRMQWVADMRGDSPTCHVHLQLSTRAGEIFSPSLLIPPGWDLIRVEGLGSSAESLAGWTMASSGATGGTLASIELRHPIRADRDCELWLEMKSSRTPGSGPRRLPVPAVRNVESCSVEGTVLDEAPWELASESSDSVTVTSLPPGDDLLKVVRWFRPHDPLAITTRVTADAKIPFLVPFRTEGSAPIDAGFSPLEGRHSAPHPGPLCANVELETRTAPRDGRYHEHRAVFQWSRAVTPEAAPTIRLPEEAELTRVTAEGKEISFVRRESQIVLNSSATSSSELTLHYRTAAHSGWVMVRDELVFPVPDCLVTEFSWNVQLHGGRALYRLPLTAATSSQNSMSLRTRLLGPLARRNGDGIFHPFSRDAWRQLLGGTAPSGAASREERIWFVAPRVPERLAMKTWNRDQSNALAWCSLLACLTSGVALRRARLRWFSRTWIYFGGSWLVLALCLPEPYAPVAGGSFLGALLAVFMPRRLAMNPDWLKRWNAPSQVAAPVSALLAIGLASVAFTQGTTPETLTQQRESFVVLDAETGETQRYVTSETTKAIEQLAARAAPAWLLRSGDYRWGEGTSLPQSDQTPLLIGRFEVLLFGDRPLTHVKIPLVGISLQEVEGTIGTERVRLIPARDGQGIVIPLTRELVQGLREAQAAQSSDAPETFVPIEIRFRPIPVPEMATQFSASIPALPESRCVLPAGWDVAERWGTMSSPNLEGRVVALGEIGQLSLRSAPSQAVPSENVSSVELQTLLEAGPLSAKIQIGVRAELRDPTKDSEFTVRLSPAMTVQTVSGGAVDQYRLEREAHQSRLRIRLRPGPVTPIEIRGVMATAQAAAFVGPIWETTADTDPTDREPSQATPIGLFAVPGYTSAEVRDDASPPAIAAQTFVDSLIPGIAWRVPDLAWSTIAGRTVRWKLTPTAPTSQARISQRIELDIPRAKWHCEAVIENSLGVPFEARCDLEPRLQVTAVSVKQDGAERLLHWSRQDNQLHLWIRDGQPGTQTLTLDGELPASYGSWTPPRFAITSSETIDSTLSIRPPPRGRIVTASERRPPATSETSSAPSEELRYQPGTPQAPKVLRIEPIGEEQSARVWIDLVPASDQTWQLHVRAQLIDAPRSTAAIRVEWSQPGLQEVRPGEKRDQLRRTTNGQGFIWRPKSSSASELSLRARFTPQGGPWTIPLPQLSSPQSRQAKLRLSELWVSVPKGSGHRPTRLSGQLQSALPASWPGTWSSGWSAARSLLFAGSAEAITIEPVSTEQLIRPFWSETLVWSGNAKPSAQGPALRGVTKYLLMAEGDATLRIDDAALPHIAAIAVDGHVLPHRGSIRIPFQSTDLSHEVTLWWESPDSPTAQALLAPLLFPGADPFPHWVGVIPDHDQVLFGQASTDATTRYWTARAFAMLSTAEGFPGAPWLVDGPLMRSMAESRQGLKALSSLSDTDALQQNELHTQWEQFLKSAAVTTSSLVTSPPPAWSPDGLHSSIALCGPGSSIWLSPLAADPAIVGPRVIPRRWSVTITAALASLLALALLTWATRLFKRYELAEIIARHPHLTLASLGVIWWLCLTPSVLGLGLAGCSLVIWYLRMRLERRRAGEA